MQTATSETHDWCSICFTTDLIQNPYLLLLHGLAQFRRFILQDLNLLHVAKRLLLGLCLLERRLSLKGNNDQKSSSHKSAQ